MLRSNRYLKRSICLSSLVALALFGLCTDSYAECNGEGVSTILTATDQSGVAADSRQLVGGIGTTVNLSTPGQISIDTSGGGGGGVTTPVTVTNETASVQLSRRLSDGNGTRVSTATPGQIAIDLVPPVSVANGGTGGTDPVGARSNLGAAKSGANGDITSLTGLSSDLSLNSHKITNVTNPALPQDAATKAYVDSAVAGFSSNITAIQLTEVQSPNTTLIDDPQLSVSIPDNTKYAFEYVIFYRDLSNGTADMKTSVLIGGAASMAWSAVVRSAGNNVDLIDAQASGGIFVAGGSSVDRMFTIVGTVQNSTGSPQVLKLQFAQNTSHSNAVKVMPNSHLTATKL